MRRSLITLLAVTLLLASMAMPAYAGSPAGNEEESTLDTIAGVIGTLGLYAAMMAILAVGAEIVIDVLKPVLGLKRDKTTAKAMDELRSSLADALQQLDLAPDAREQLNLSMSELEGVTARFGNQMERVHIIVQEQLPDILKDLAVNSVAEVIERHWPSIVVRLQESVELGITEDVLARLEESEPDLARRLRQLGGTLDTDAALEAVRAWLVKTLNRLKGMSVAEIEAEVEKFNELLQAIERQRHQLEGPARKIWRWLRDSHWSRGWLGWLLIRCEYAWTWVREKLPQGGFSEQLAYLRTPYTLPPVRDLQEAFGRLLEVSGQSEVREQRRITWLRVISAIVGVGLAATLRVDSLQLLASLLGEAADAFRSQGGTGEWYTFAILIERGAGRSIDPRLALPGILGRAAAALLHLTPGTVLSGLGAAAGSGFWHDQLARLRSFKEAARQAEELTQ